MIVIRSKFTIPCSSFFEAKKRSKKALKKYRATSSAQKSNPAAPSHTATPFFHLALLSELMLLFKAIRWLGAPSDGWARSPQLLRRSKERRPARIPSVCRPSGWKDYSGKRFWTLFGRMQKVSEISD